MKVSINNDDNTITIVLPISKDPPVSASGKTKVVASTNGFFVTNETVNGKHVSVSVNCTISNR